MTTLLFLFLAAAFSAVMDTLKDHYSTSIFCTFKNQNFWNPYFGWRNIVLNFMAIDAWHLSKMAMLGCLYCAIFFHSTIFGWVDFLLYLMDWFVGFQLFYSVILKK